MKLKIIQFNQQVSLFMTQLIQKDKYDVLILAIASFLFYFFCLGCYPFFTPDEGRYSEIAREMIASHDYITPRINGVPFLDKPILHYWLQVIAFSLFGLHEWSARFFPALFGILCILMTYVFGKRYFNRRTGLLSAIILATTPLYFGGAHYANLDLEVACFISATLFCFVRVAKNPKPSPYYLWGMYIFSACAFLTKGLIGIAFPAMIAGSWILLTGQWNLLIRIRLIAGLFLFSVITLPWYILVQRANPDFLQYFFVHQQMTRFLSNATFNNPTPFWFYLPVVLAGFFPWTIFIFQSFYLAITQVVKARKEHQITLFLLLWASIIFIFFSIPHSKIVGYILPVFPPLSLLVGCYVSTLWEKIPKNSLRFSSMLFITFCMIFILSLFAALHFHWLSYLENSFFPYFIAISIILILSACTTSIAIKKQSLPILFAIATLCSMLILFCTVFGATHINQRSTKTLTTYLKNIIQPQDEVITYFRYYHDVPLYLNRLVTVVADWRAFDILKKDNWMRELSYNHAAEKIPDRLIDEATFWQRFESDKRVFVFINTHHFDQFKLKANIYFNLGKENNVLLISNQPTISTENPAFIHNESENGENRQHNQ